MSYDQESHGFSSVSSKTVMTYTPKIWLEVFLSQAPAAADSYARPCLSFSGGWRGCEGSAKRMCLSVLATILIQSQPEGMGEASQIHSSIEGAVSEAVANKEVHCLDTAVVSMGTLGNVPFGNKTEATFTVLAG